MLGHTWNDFGMDAENDVRVQLSDKHAETHSGWVRHGGRLTLPSQGSQTRQHRRGGITAEMSFEWLSLRLSYLVRCKIRSLGKMTSVCNWLTNRLYSVGSTAAGVGGAAGG